MNKKKKFLLLCASKKSDLPAGYTALEYLESSGTQYIDTGLQTTASTEIELKAQQIHFASSGSYYWLFGATTSPEYNLGLSWGSAENPTSTGFVGYAVIGNVGGTGKIDSVNNDFRAQPFTVANKNGTFVINGRPMLLTALGNPNVLPGSTLTYLLFALSRESGSYTPNPGLRIFGFKDTTNGELRLRLIPALRNSDGVPGMWDAVSKQFFTNAGTGVFGYRVKGAPAAFSLRDPHRAAPSGVYARKASETELEIIADTEETSGDGWEWFSNSADAMEHFGIIMSEQI